MRQRPGYVDYGTPWQEMTRTAGRALGREEEAAQLIADVEERFVEARAGHPAFEGAELVYAGVYGEGQMYVESLRSARFGLMQALGFVAPAAVDELAGDEFYVDISQEQMTLLDHDLLVWELGAAEGVRTSITGNPIYQLLDVVREGRDIFIDEKVLAGALAHATVLSLPYALERLIPMLAATIDGDPATEVEYAS